MSPTTKKYDIAVDFDYDDPSADAALAWLDAHYFRSTPGFVEAYVENSLESSDETVPNDLMHTVRAHFSIESPSAKDAVLGLFRSFATARVSNISGVAVDGAWLDCDIWSELLLVLV